MENITYKKTTGIALAGLFAAITAACSWISIPLGFTPIPVNLATLAVLLSGGLLGKKYGAVSLTVYTLVGAVGAPVFAGFRGGIGVLAGPTGGYIIGYIAAAFIVGALMEAVRTEPKTGPVAGVKAGNKVDGKVDTRAGAKAWEIIKTVAAMVAGLAVCYILGTAWFMFSTGSGIEGAMIACVIPFLPGEVLKIIAATLLVRKLKKFLN